MQAYLAEFIGTALLVLLGNGVVANVLLDKTKGHGAGWISITTGWGLAVFVAVWCVGPISGAHINPAVTLGLAVAGEFPWADVAPYIAAQMLGAIVGGALVFLFYRQHYELTTDADAKLATFCTAPAIRSTVSNLFSELIGTMVLVLAVLLVVEPSITTGFESSSASFSLSAVLDPSDGELGGGMSSAAGGASDEIGLGTLGALPVGLLVLSIGISLGGTTGYAINPARDLGPRIAHALLPVPGKRDANWGYAWIPVVGPLAGALLAVALADVLAT
jgi:glycerol uptake facilitator protein